MISYEKAQIHFFSFLKKINKIPEKDIDNNEIITRFSFEATDLIVGEDDIDVPPEFFILSQDEKEVDQWSIYRTKEMSSSEKKRIGQEFIRKSSIIALVDLNVSKLRNITNKNNNRTLNAKTYPHPHPKHGNVKNMVVNNNMAYQLNLAQRMKKAIISIETGKELKAKIKKENQS